MPFGPLSNIPVTRMHPIDASRPAWLDDRDVSYAVAEACGGGEPLRLISCSAHGSYHSGKYFWNAEVGDWTAAVHPTLEVIWGAAAPAAPTRPTIK